MRDGFLDGLPSQVSAFHGWLTACLVACCCYSISSCTTSSNLSGLDAKNSIMSLQPTTWLVANGNDTIDLVVQAKQHSGSPIVGLIIHANLPTGFAVVTNNIATDTTGTATFKLSSTIASNDQAISAKGTFAGEASGVLPCTVTPNALSTTASVGIPINLGITPKFADANTTYTGTVHFTSSDPNAILPENTTFVASDMGRALLTGGATFFLEGTQTVTATDVATSQVVDIKTLQVVPGAAAKLNLTLSPSTQTAGVESTLTITAVDENDNQLLDYAGLVQIVYNETDAQATTATGQTTYQFGPSDHSTTQVPIIFRTAGVQSLKVFDTSSANVVGDTSMTITPAAPAAFNIQPPANLPMVAGVSQPITIAVVDEFNNITPGYTGPIQISLGQADTRWSLASATQNTANNTYSYQYNPTTDQGIKTFGNQGLLLTKAYSNQNLIVTDMSPGIAGFSANSNLTINPGNPDHLSFQTQPASTVWSDQVFGSGLIVAVQDNYNNQVTTWSNPISLTLKNGSSNTSLNGILYSANAPNGQVNFSNVRVHGVGQSLQIVASTAGLSTANSVSSQSFQAAAQPLTTSVLSVTTPSITSSGCVNIPYALNANGFFNIKVEYDPNQSGTWYTASSAAVPPGGASYQGRLNLNPSKFNNQLSFLWDSTADLPGFSNNTSQKARVRITAQSVSDPTVTISQTTGSFTLQNGVSLANAVPGTLAAATCMATADFNLDGNVDIAFCQGTSVGVILGKSKSPTFGAPQNYNLPTGASALTSLIAQDFDRDGKTDLLALYSVGSSGKVVFLQGSSSGTLTVASKTTSLFGSTAPTAMAAVDLNKDGILDIVAVSKAGNQVFWAFGDGTGAFPTAPATAMTGTGSTGPVALAVGDINKDGYADVVIANNTAKTVAILLSNTSGSSPTWAINSSSVTLGNAPLAVQVADVNRDGNLDIAVITNAISNNLTLLLGNGDGSFKASPSSYSATTSSATPVDLILLDLNNDGSLDTVVASSGNIHVALGNSNSTGTFAIPQSVSAGVSAIAHLGVVDFNHDNRPDMIAINNASPGFSVLMNTRAARCGSQANFQLGKTAFLNTTTSAAPQNTLIGDFNEDGIPDVLVISNSNQYPLYFGDGSGGLQAAISANIPAIFTYSSNAGIGALADLDGDNHLDVVVPNSSAGGGVMLLYGDGTGQFTPITPNISTITSATQFTQAAIGDFNQDGLPDFVLLNNSSSSQIVWVFLNQGNRTFTSSPAIYSAGGSNATSLAVGDMNGDGNLDLLIADSSNNLNVLLGSSNGVFSKASSPSFSVCQEPKSIALADVNGDGKADAIVACQTSQFIDTFVSTSISGQFGFQAPIKNTIVFSNGSNGTSTLNQPFLADMNGDGKLDLIGSFASNAFYVGVGDGLGNFNNTVSHQYLGSLSPGAYINAQDMTGDKTPDIVLMSNPCSGCSGSLASSRVNVYRTDAFYNLFTPQTIPINPIEAEHVVVGDFNLDGAMDYLVSGYSYANNSYNTMLELAYGSSTSWLPTTSSVNMDFGLGSKYSLKGLGFSYFNSDAYPDIFLVGQDFLDVFFFQPSNINNLSNSFIGPINPNASLSLSPILKVLLQDLNRDGIVDILSGVAVNSSITFYQGDGVGGDIAQKNPSNVLTYPNSLVDFAVADINNDGYPDIVTSQGVSNSRVFLNTTLGPNRLTVSSSSQISPSGHNCSVWYLADLNHDGWVDGICYESSNKFSMAMNTAGQLSYVFSANITGSTTNQPDSFDVADVNDDGNLDIVIATGQISDAFIAVFYGDGSGNMSNAQYYTVGATPVSIKLADVDRNGFVDVITALHYGSTLAVGLNN